MEKSMTTTDPTRSEHESQEVDSRANVEGLVNLASPYPVGATLDRLESALQARGATIFTRIDHAAGAAKVGLTMNPAQVLIFGNPRIGTPVMKAAPTVAIDLPFKALAWQDDAGRAWLSYNSAEYLARRHQIAREVVVPLATIAAAIADALRSEIQPDDAGESAPQK